MIKSNNDLYILLQKNNEFINETGKFRRGNFINCKNC